MALAEQSSQSDDLTKNSHTARVSSRPRIVIPLDGSTLSEQALDVGESLARILDGTIELVHVVDPAQAPDEAASRHNAEDYLSRIAAKLAAEFPVTCRVLTGNPEEQLLANLQHAPRTIVAMSTHGRSGLQRLLFGSVADQVIRDVAIPVAVVRDKTNFTPAIRHLLVPLDGSDHAATALPAAMSLTDHERTLGIVRVLDSSHTHENLALKYGSIWSDSDLVNEMAVDAERNARATQEEIAVRLRAAGYHTSWEVRSGHASDEIIRVAETTGADLIVMATHGLGGVRRWAFGSVTDEVIHQSHVPVLVIPPHYDWTGSFPPSPTRSTDR